VCSSDLDAQDTGTGMVVKIISIEQSAFSVEPAISLGNLLCAAKNLGSICGIRCSIGKSLQLYTRL